MSSRIKSISLDEQTEKIASMISSNGGNFSAFVRECLIRYHAQTGGAMNCRRHRTKADNRPVDRLCRPFMPNRCIVCWPVGEPERDAWAEYTKGPDRYETRIHKYSNLPGDHPGTSSIYTDPEHPDFAGWYSAGEKYEARIFTQSEYFNDHVWIQAEAERINPPLFNLNEMEIKGNAKPAKTSRRRRRSLIRWLFGLVRARS